MNNKLVITELNLPSIKPADIAVTYESDKVTKVDIFYKDSPFIIGNIYTAYVSDLAKNINAAFVEYDSGKKAYLSLENNNNIHFINKKNTDKLCESDIILIQIKKEPIKTKDAVCDTVIELPKKYVVLTYGKPGINVSSKLKDKVLRDNLNTVGREFFNELSAFFNKNKQQYGMITDDIFYSIVSKTGFIFRTESGLAEKEMLTKDLESAFLELFSIINKALYSKGKVLIKEAENPIMNIACEVSYDEIITDNMIYYEECKNAGLNVRFYEDKLLPLYKLYSIEAILSEITSRKIWLKSGGYLIIDYTEAMTVIDINTGKCEKGKNKQDTILKINLEAALETMRQIRLRNISGIIIVDFIDMTDEEHKQKLLQTLKQEASRDKIKTVIMGMTRLNLVEITRKKIRERITIEK